MRVPVLFGKLRRRLTPALVIATLILLGAVATYTYFSYQQAASELVIERNRQLAFLSAARFRDELSKFANELIAVARTPDLTGGNPSVQQRALERAQNRLVVFDGGVVLLDNFGRVRASEPDRLEILNQDWADRDYFRGMLASSTPYLSDIVRDGPEGAEVIVMSVPIVGVGGELVGVLAGMFRIGEQTTSSFYASIVRLRLGQSGSTYLVDGSDTILYDSTLDAIGKPAQDSGLPYKAVHDEVNALRTRDENGNDIVAAYAPVPGTRWILVTEDDWGSLTGAVQRYARNLLLLLALGILLPPIGVALLIRQQQSEVLKREQAEQEKRVAGMVQQLVIPRSFPTLPGWDLTYYHQQSPTGERDFCDVWLRPDGCLMLALGDVSDRGLKAAHIISSTRAILRGTAQRTMSPDEALECSNELLAPDVDDDLELACLYAVLDPAGGQLTFASAGFPWPCVCHDGLDQRSDAPGSLLGQDFQTRFGAREVMIQPNGCAILFSNGLSDAANADGEPFGRDRVCAAINEPSDDARDIVEAVLSALRSFTGRSRQEQADDITIVALKRLSQPGQSAPAGSV